MLSSALSGASRVGAPFDPLDLAPARVLAALDAPEPALTPSPEVLLGTPPVVDPRRRLWIPLTIRVAWELVKSGVGCRLAVLREARDHVLWSLPNNVGLEEAEVRASAAVAQLVSRWRGVYAPMEIDPDVALFVDPAWRELIAGSADSYCDAVFRLHYADGLPLEEVGRRTGAEASHLRAAREGIRAMARALLLEDGLSTQGWEGARLDRLVGRIACAAGDRCPGPGGLATESGRAHADNCPRCSRALRLMREGALSPSDLFPPDHGGLPAGELDLLLVMVHPDARRQMRTLRKTFGEATILLDADTLMVDTAAVPDHELRLRRLAENGTPGAAQMRILRKRFASRMGRRSVLGPAPELARAATAGMAWGDVLGTPSLPEPLPPPPSAARLWASALVVTGLAVLVGAVALLPAAPEGDVRVEARHIGDGVAFTTEDRAMVDVVAVRSGVPTVVFHSDDPFSKAQLATGDGRYAWRGEADAYLVVGSTTPLGLDRLPISDPQKLRDLVREQLPTATVRLVQP